MSKNTVRTDMIRSSGKPFLQIPMQFVDESSELSGQARWLYVLLSRFINHSQNVAFPSYDYIQKQTGWARAVIRPALEQLMQTGWISVEKQLGSVNIYTIHVEPVPVEKQATSSPNELVVVQKMNCTSSGNELPLVQEMNCKYINTKHIKENSTSSRSSGSKNPHYDCFAAAYRRHYEYPYVSKQADFVQYKKWKTADNGLTDDSQFEIAVRNYFDSPLKAHTFAHLVTQFAVFRKSALDRFGKPVESRNPPTPGSAAPLPPQGCVKCVQGWVLPTKQGEYARKCECNN